MWSTLKATPTAKRNVISALAAVLLAAAVPQAGLAMTNSETGLWRVTKQTMGPNSGRMVIERVKKGEAVNNGGTFLVIRKGKAYLATPQSIAGAGGATAVNYSAWSDMKLEHIGTNVRAVDDCFSRCQHGFQGDRMTVTFKTVKAAQPAAPGIVALEGKK
jgi:hypothetical protein